MEIKNQILPIFRVSDLENESITIKNSYINKIDLAFTRFEYSNLVITGCTIGKLFLHTAWFSKGFVLSNCVIEEEFNYEMGGHNEEPIVIKNNIFCKFAIFFDCQFNELLIVENNIFCKGTNILIDFHTGANNSFAKSTRINNNLGELDYEREF